MLINQIKYLLFKYDPYGFHWVNSIQSAIMVIVLFLVQSCYNIPGFNIAMQLPFFGLIATGSVIGYNNRLKAMAIFSFACITYAVVLSLVYNYRTLVVLTVGVMISIFFMLSKKNTRITWNDCSFTGCNVYII